jgi:hypothetical protein
MLLAPSRITTRSLKFTTIMQHGFSTFWSDLSTVLYTVFFGFVCIAVIGLAVFLLIGFCECVITPWAEGRFSKRQKQADEEALQEMVELAIDDPASLQSQTQTQTQTCMGNMQVQARTHTQTRLRPEGSMFAFPARPFPPKRYDSMDSSILSSDISLSSDSSSSDAENDTPSEVSDSDISDEERKLRPRRVRNGSHLADSRKRDKKRDEAKQELLERLMNGELDEEYSAFLQQEALDCKARDLAQERLAKIRAQRGLV